MSSDEEPSFPLYTVYLLKGGDRLEQVRCGVVVNYNEFECIPDRGSCKSLCSLRIARLMGLRSTGVVKLFKGLGRSSASLAVPVFVKLQLLPEKPAEK